MSVVIAGYYGFRNAGDELILHSLITQLRTKDPGLSITVLSRTPAVTALDFSVQAVDRWNPFHWIKPLLYSQRFILGGGGLLQESTGFWNYAYYLSLVLVAKIAGCQTEIFAIGVDPISRRFNQFWARFILQHWADSVSVRDEMSRNALTEAGVRCPIEVRPDPVFNLILSCPADRAGGVALALSPSKDRPQWSEEVAYLCERLSSKILAPIDLLVFFPTEDASFAREVAHYTSSIRQVRLWDKPADVLSWIPQYELVIATRYHALVLAAISQTPFIGWGEQNKVRALCQSFEQPYWDPDEGWDVENQLKQILGQYKTGNKGVILKTRID